MTEVDMKMIFYKKMLLMIDFYILNGMSKYVGMRFCQRNTLY